jgi:hypothetical protein
LPLPRAKNSIQQKPMHPLQSALFNVLLALKESLGKQPGKELGYTANDELNGMLNWLGSRVGAKHPQGRPWPDGREPSKRLCETVLENAWERPLFQENRSDVVKSIQRYQALPGLPAPENLETENTTLENWKMFFANFVSAAVSKDVAGRQTAKRGHAAIAVELDVLVKRKHAEWQSIDEMGVLPLRHGDLVCFNAKAKPQAYLYLVSINPYGKAFCFHPWLQVPTGNPWVYRSELDVPKISLTIPCGPPYQREIPVTRRTKGAETLILLACETAIPAGELEEMFVNLPKRIPYGLENRKECFDLQTSTSGSRNTSGTRFEVDNQPHPLNFLCELLIHRVRGRIDGGVGVVLPTVG